MSLIQTASATPPSDGNTRKGDSGDSLVGSASAARPIRQQPEPDQVQQPVVMSASQTAVQTGQAAVDQRLPFKDFNATCSFVCSIGIAFSLTNSVSAADPRTQQLYGFASVAFVTSLSLTTVAALLITDGHVLAAFEKFAIPADSIANGEKVAGAPPATWPLYRRLMVKLIFWLSYAGLFALWAAFFVTAAALRRTAGAAVGNSFLAVLGGIPAFGFLAWGAYRGAHSQRAFCGCLSNLE